MIAYASISEKGNRSINEDAPAKRELAKIYLCQFSFLCYDEDVAGRHNAEKSDKKTKRS